MYINSVATAVNQNLSTIQLLLEEIFRHNVNFQLPDPSIFCRMHGVHISMARHCCSPLMHTADSPGAAVATEDFLKFFI